MANVFHTEDGKLAIMNYYDMLIEKIEIPHKQTTVQTEFGSTFVFEFGEPTSEPMILLHGSSMNSATWFGDIKEFYKQYHVFAVDMPGEPGKSEAIQYAFDTDEYADWLCSVLDKLGLDQAIIVGLSLGGWLAAKFAVKHQSRISKLILLCPAGIGSQNNAFKEIALSLLPKGEEGVNELFRKINGDDDIPELALNYQKLIGMFFNTRKEEIPLFTDKQLQSITVPTFLFVGGNDILLKSEETAQRVKNLVPKADITIFPEKGHSLIGLAKEIIEKING